MPWYPKDWWTSDTFFILTPLQRYIYLELLFMMYMTRSGVIKNDPILIGKKLYMDIMPADWIAVSGRLLHCTEGMYSESVAKRRTKAETARENGAQGGRPKKPNNPEKKPSVETQTKTQKTHLLEEKKKENRNRTTTDRREGSSSSTSAVSKPPTPSRPPLRAALRDGSGDQVQAITEDYGQELIDLTDAKKISAKMSLMAFMHYWPGEVDETENTKLEKVFAGMSETEKIDALRSLAGSVRYGAGNGFDFKPAAWKSPSDYAERTIFRDDEEGSES